MPSTCWCLTGVYDMANQSTRALNKTKMQEEKVSEFSKVQIPTSSGSVPQIWQPADARCGRRPMLGVAMTCICTPRVLGRLPPV